MPSPFPGMDPFLENRMFWRGVHQSLIAFANVELNTYLPPGFSANIEERVYIAGPDAGGYPDIYIHREEPERLTVPSGSVGVLERPVEATIPQRLTVASERVRESYIEVSQHETGTVVAVIEVLSPANKRHGTGREEYVRKQQSVLTSDVHLLEIDLLRGGLHTVAAPENALRPQAHWDYIVCLHRGGQSEVTLQTFDYWPILLAETLPTVFLPLTPGLKSVTLPLQKLFDQVYDGGPYARRIRYDDAPQVPLEGDDAVWADTLLREQGLRPASQTTPT